MQTHSDTHTAHTQHTLATHRETHKKSHIIFFTQTYVHYSPAHIQIIAASYSTYTTLCTHLHFETSTEFREEGKEPPQKRI